METRENVVIYLLRRDLRVEDNPVLHHLVTNCTPFTRLLPVYVLEPHQIEVSNFVKPGQRSPYPEARSRLGRFWRCGPHRARFTAQSVWDVKLSLTALGSGLVVRIGSYRSVVRTLVQGLRQTGNEVGAIWMTDDVGWEEHNDQQDVASACEEFGVHFRLWNDAKYFVDDENPKVRNLAYLPGDFSTWRRSISAVHDEPQFPFRCPHMNELPAMPAGIPSQEAPFEIPDDFGAFEARLTHPTLSILPNMPTKPPNGTNSHQFQGGETAARRRVREIVSSGLVSHFQRRRNELCGRDSSSKLGAYLAHGCVTARHIYHSISYGARNYDDGDDDDSEDEEEDDDEDCEDEGDGTRTVQGPVSVFELDDDTDDDDEEVVNRRLPVIEEEVESVDADVKNTRPLAIPQEGEDGHAGRSADNATEPSEEHSQQGDHKLDGAAALFDELLRRDYMRLCAKKHGAALFRQSGFRGDRSLRWFSPDPRRADPDQEPPPREVARWLDHLQRGTTGTELVDASMRELLHTGYTSSRARQTVATFVAKGLRLDWRYGAEWYECMLIDYDACSNWGNWQYLAGVGTESAGDTTPLHLLMQSRLYDPCGDFVRMWVPELGAVAPEVDDPPRGGGTESASQLSTNGPLSGLGTSGSRHSHGGPEYDSSSAILLSRGRRELSGSNHDGAAFFAFAAAEPNGVDCGVLEWWRPPSPGDAGSSRKSVSFVVEAPAMRSAGGNDPSRAYGSRGPETTGATLTSRGPIEATFPGGRAAGITSEVEGLVIDEANGNSEDPEERPLYPGERDLDPQEYLPVTTRAGRFNLPARVVPWLTNMSPSERRAKTGSSRISTCKCGAVQYRHQLFCRRCGIVGPRVGPKPRLNSSWQMDSNSSDDSTSSGDESDYSEASLVTVVRARSSKASGQGLPAQVGFEVVVPGVTEVVSSGPIVAGPVANPALVVPVVEEEESTGGAKGKLAPNFDAEELSLASTVGEGPAEPSADEPEMPISESVPRKQRARSYSAPLLGTSEPLISIARASDMPSGTAGFGADSVVAVEEVPPTAATMTNEDTQTVVVPESSQRQVIQYQNSQRRQGGAPMIRTRKTFAPAHYKQRIRGGANFPVTAPLSRPNVGGYGPSGGAPMVTPMVHPPACYGAPPSAHQQSMVARKWAVVHPPAHTPSQGPVQHYPAMKPTRRAIAHAHTSMTPYHPPPVWSRRVATVHHPPAMAQSQGPVQHPPAVEPRWAPVVQHPISMAPSYPPSMAPSQGAMVLPSRSIAPSYSSVTQSHAHYTTAAAPGRGTYPAQPPQPPISYSSPPAMSAMQTAVDATYSRQALSSQLPQPHPWSGPFVPPQQSAYATGVPHVAWVGPGGGVQWELYPKTGVYVPEAGYGPRWGSGNEFRS